MKLKITIVGLMFAFSFGIQGCYYDNKQDLLQSNGICDTSLTTFAAVIHPIIIANCNTQSGCHGGASLGSVSLEGYVNIQSQIADIVNRIKSGSMPKNNPKLDDCSIAKIESWLAKGAQNN